MTAAKSPPKSAHRASGNLIPGNLTPTQRTGRILLLAFLALAGIFVYGYVQRANRMAQIELQIHQIEQMISEAHRERAVLEAELRYVATDDYLDRVARAELGMAKPGETALVVLDAPAAAAQAQQAPSSASELLPDVTHEVSRSSLWQEQLQQERLWRDWLNLFRLAPRN